jgi:hypothetical protein
MLGSVVQVHLSPPSIPESQILASSKKPLSMQIDRGFLHCVGHLGLAAFGTLPDLTMGPIRTWHWLRKTTQPFAVPHGHVK